ncbi:MAG: hypothetical protein AVDCRST_MAG19-4511, partial [uncultured Thermomicrobiales bacterium]
VPHRPALGPHHSRAPGADRQRRRRPGHGRGSGGDAAGRGLPRPREPLSQAARPPVSEGLRRVRCPRGGVRHHRAPDAASQARGAGPMAV